MWVIKTNSNGEEEWTTTYGGERRDFSYSIKSTLDGGYIIVGYTYSFGAGNSDIYLIKINSFGDTLWTKTFGGKIDPDYGRSVLEDSDGGYIIVGYTTLFNNRYDVWLLKTNSSGDTLWTKSYGAEEHDYPLSVQQTSDDGYIISGGTWSFGNGEYDTWIIKTDSLGDTLWTKTFGGSGLDWGVSILQTSDGGYIIVGSTESFGAGNYDIWLIKTNTMGDSIWTKTFGGTEKDIGFSILQATDGGYIIVGYTESFGAGDEDVWIIKTNSSGSILWSKTFGGAGSDRGYSVIQSTDGEYIIAGLTESFGSGSADVWLLKIVPNPTALILETTLIDYRLSQNYPNPFNPSTSIQYAISSRQFVSLKVYDVLGKKIATLIEEEKPAGSYEVEFIGKGLPSGVYLYRLSVDNGYSETRKMLLIK